MGTVINSNYWRIEGIKNVYDVFQKEVSEKFEKDLSEFRIEETEKNIKTDEIEKQEEPSSEKQTKAKKAIKIGGKEKKDSKAEEEKNKFIDDIFEDMDLNEKEFEEDYEDDDEDDYDEEDYEYNNNEEEKEDFIEDDYEFFEEDEEDEDDEDDFLDDEDDENIFDDDLEEEYEDDDEEEDDDDFFDDEDFLNDEENEDTDEEDFFDIDEENDEDEDFDIDEEDEDDLNIYEIDIDDDDIEKNNEKDFLDNYNEFIGNKKYKKKAEEKEKNKKAQKETKSKDDSDFFKAIYIYGQIIRCTKNFEEMTKTYYSLMNTVVPYRMRRCYTLRFAFDLLWSDEIDDKKKADYIKLYDELLKLLSDNPNIDSYFSRNIVYSDANMENIMSCIMNSK